MHQLASGAGTAVGLVGVDGPPLSTETVGRPPSILGAAPVSLKSYETILAERGAAAPVPVAAETPAESEARRVVVRLLGGEELELGSFDGRDGAVAAAQELVAQFTSAEASGEWPEVEGRFLRPASVVSIDVLSQA